MFHKAEQFLHSVARNLASSPPSTTQSPPLQPFQLANNLHMSPGIPSPSFQGTGSAPNSWLNVISNVASYFASDTPTPTVIVPVAIPISNIPNIPNSTPQPQLFVSVRGSKSDPTFSATKCQSISYSTCSPRKIAAAKKGWDTRRKMATKKPSGPQRHLLRVCLVCSKEYSSFKVFQKAHFKMP